jgi:hypothetical protein
MTVNGKPDPKPNWAYYNLATEFEGDVVRMGARYGADAIDAGQIATAVAMAICFHPNIANREAAKRLFFRNCKFRFHSFYKRRERAESEFENYRQGFMRQSESGNDLLRIFDKLDGGSTGANQYHIMYLKQVLAEVGLLPNRIRRVMLLLIEGHTPLEIAIANKWKAEHVLRDIKIARDWLESANYSPLLDLPKRKETRHEQVCPPRPGEAAKPRTPGDGRRQVGVEEAAPRVGKEAGRRERQAQKGKVSA